MPSMLRRIRGASRHCASQPAEVSRPASARTADKGSTHQVRAGPRLIDSTGRPQGLYASVHGQCEPAILQPVRYPLVFLALPGDCRCRALRRWPTRDRTDYSRHSRTATGAGAATPRTGIPVVRRDAVRGGLAATPRVLPHHGDRGRSSARLRTARPPRSPWSAGRSRGHRLVHGRAVAADPGVVEAQGWAFRLAEHVLKEEFARGGALQHLLLLYTQALLTLTAQTAVCYRFHTLEQQVCRWLLLTLDRSTSSELWTTHEKVP